MIRSAIAILMLFAATAAADTITLRSATVGSTGEVTLGAISEIKGDRAQAMADVVVATVSDAEPSAAVRLSAVRERLDQRGAHWGKLSLRGPRSITVTLSAGAGPAADPPTKQTIDANPIAPIDLSTGGRTLRQVVHAFIHGQHDVPAGDLRVEFADPDAEVWSLTDAAGRFELDPTDRDLLGRVPIVVRRYAGDQLIGEQRVRLSVTVRRDVVVAARAIDRGQTIIGDDVTLESRWFDSADIDSVDSINEALGMTASRRLRSGDLIESQTIEPRRLVQRGQVMTVRAISGGLVVKTIGRAMEDGYRGQMIEVRNDRTREKFYVRVSGPQTGVMLVGGSADPAAAVQGGHS